MLKIHDKGLKNFRRKLKDLELRGNSIKGENPVPFTELFPTLFMEKYTNFLAIKVMLNKSPFKIDTEEDFVAIDESLWDKFICDNTRFTTWEEMLQTAATEWTAKKLGF